MKSRAVRVVTLVALIAAITVVGSVAPRVRAATEVHFTAAGDYGARASTATVLDEVAERSPDAHLALGDLKYGDVATETAWCNYVKARVGEGFPLELIAGNHETVDDNDGAINNFSACLPNQIPGIVGTYGREYYMDFPKGAPLVRVIQVGAGLTFEDGVWQYAQGDAHYTWLSNAIDSGRAAGAQWIIVTMHYPCLSVGIYNCTTPDVFRLLASKKVDLVLHGHEHAYMRTHQLTSGVPGCATIPIGSFDADCVVDTDNAFAAGHGSVFATVGTGGTPLRAVNSSDTEAAYFAAFQGLGTNGTFGLLDLAITDTQLTAQFVPTSGGTFTDSFTITKGPPPPNVPPVASMTAQMQARTVTVDGSDSSDSDGTIVDYEWDFGDGSTATGPTPPPHTYTANGNYTVSLTVRDDDGATDSTSQLVTATDGPPVLADDTFTRTVASGWGTTLVGGAWTVSPASAFSVNGSEGVLTSNAGNGRNTYLRGISSTSTDLRVTFGINKVTTGSGLYLSTVGRSIIGAGDYRSVLRFHNDGRLAIRLSRTAANGAETFLVNETVLPGLTYVAGDRVHIRQQVTGTSPTTLRVRVWKAGTPEPSTWNFTATDSTSNLQGAGAVGFVTYLSGSATNAPIVLTADDLVVTQP